jgi:hypothetical protein
MGVFGIITHCFALFTFSSENWQTIAEDTRLREYPTFMPAYAHPRATQQVRSIVSYGAFIQQIEILVRWF